MADAQTPVLTDEQIRAGYRAYDWRVRAADHGGWQIWRDAVAWALAAQAPAQPDRAVMQQALDAIAPRFRSGNAVPVDKAVVPAAEWNALVAALSATMEKPNGN